MKIYCIKHEMDIVNIPLDEPIQLEIYLKKALIPLRAIWGHCLVRAADCSFPLLERITHNLSVDAEGVRFLSLQQVDGNCKIHEKGAYLPLLKHIGGSLLLLEQVGLPELTHVGNKLKNTSKVNLPKLVWRPKEIWEIKNQDDVSKLPQDGNCSVNILADNIEITHTEIKGLLKINGHNPKFHNLKRVRGIVVGYDVPLTLDRTISFPQLVKIRRNCIVISGNIFCPVLSHISGRVLVMGKVNVPKLKQVGRLDLSNEVDNKRSFPSLSAIHGTFTPNGDDYHLPALEYCKEVDFWGSETSYPKLKSIGILNLHAASARTIFPALANVGYGRYNEKNKYLAEIVENLFFDVTPVLQVSQKEFTLDVRLPLSRSKMYPILDLVAILKTKHRSFQNFFTREFEREWQKPHNRINTVLEEIKKRWDLANPLTIEAIFRLWDRNIRRFCFSYLGVSDIMKFLEAKRVATAGIELNYFCYDKHGNKKPFQKHNIYEVYEANMSKIQDFPQWDTARTIVYAVKCWCTSTEHEHWLWIEAKYKDDPLAAIASTFRIHENLIPHIKCLKRQGDILICEMKQDVRPEGAVRALTKEEYFGLLEVET